MYIYTWLKFWLRKRLFKKNIHLSMFSFHALPLTRSFEKVLSITDLNFKLDGMTSLIKKIPNMKVFCTSPGFQNTVCLNHTRIKYSSWSHSNLSTEWTIVKNRMICVRYVNVCHEIICISACPTSFKIESYKINLSVFVCLIEKCPASFILIRMVHVVLGLTGYNGGESY